MPQYRRTHLLPSTWLQYLPTVHIAGSLPSPGQHTAYGISSTEAHPSLIPAPESSPAAPLPPRAFIARSQHTPGAPLSTHPLATHGELKHFTDVIPRRTATAARALSFLASRLVCPPSSLPFGPGRPLPARLGTPGPVAVLHQRPPPVTVSSHYPSWHPSLSSCGSPFSSLARPPPSS